LCVKPFGFEFVSSVQTQSVDWGGEKVGRIETSKRPWNATASLQGRKLLIFNGIHGLLCSNSTHATKAGQA
jgi:hypothetical protein